jgi:hypothetical protein
MSKKPAKPKKKPAKPAPPDGRGPRPTDPNQLARWLVEQATS